MYYISFVQPLPPKKISLQYTIGLVQGFLCLVYQHYCAFIETPLRYPVVAQGHGNSVVIFFSQDEFLHMLSSQLYMQPFRCAQDMGLGVRLAQKFLTIETIPSEKGQSQYLQSHVMGVSSLLMPVLRCRAISPECWDQPSLEGGHWPPFCYCPKKIHDTVNFPRN